MKRLAAVAIALLSVGSGAACGGDSGPPDKVELVSTLKARLQLPDEQAECVTDRLLASGLSEDLLRKVAAADEDGVEEADRARVEKELGEAFQACTSAG